jgi:mono/diheme cytochrome c family protein
MKIRKLLMIAFAVIVAGFLLIQVVPYGRAHDNPTVVSEPNWDSPQTRELAQRACFDCHSNETVWPWYSNVAPVSWLVQHDVDEGRQYLNFSEWGRGGEGEETEELYEVIVDGKMPMPNYLVTHPEARLTDAEKAALADGLLATTGASSGEVESDHDSD